MISNKAKYATRAILELSIHDSSEPLSILDISIRQNIPLKFLQQILASLKTGGWVVSRKGPGGGYKLARPASSITLADILRAMDGPLAMISCTSVMLNNADCGCPDAENCMLKVAFGDVRTAMMGVLESTTFADLAKKTKKSS